MNVSRIYVCGLNLENALNKLLTLGRNSLPIRSVKRIDRKNFVIEVNIKDESKVVAYLNEKCYNVTKIERKGLRNFLFLCRKNAILAVFAVITTVLLFFLPNLCLRLEIEYDGDKAQVLDCLNEYGIKTPSLLLGLNYDQLENFLSAKIDSAMYAVVSRSGSTLRVNVLPKQQPPFQLTDYNSRYDIVATHDGIISSMTVLNGVALVSAGERVSVGQTLVAGLRPYYDQMLPTHAIAEVYALVESCATVVHQPQTIEYVRSGNKQVVSTVKLFKAQSKGKEITFEHYETEVKQYSLAPLNIVVTTTVAYELTPTVKNYTFQEKIEQYKAQALEKALQEIDFTVKDTQYTVGEDSVKVTLYGEIQINAEKIGG